MTPSKFRQMVVEELGQEFEIIIKKNSWSPFHAASHDSLTRYWGLETPPGGQRREIFSLDARREIDENGKPKRPDEQEAYSLFYRIFQTKSRKQKKNAIILDLESALQISNTLSYSNYLFYAKEFQLRYIANGIITDAGDNLEKSNLFVIGLGGYYDPWKKTYGAGLFVGFNIRSILKKIF